MYLPHVVRQSLVSCGCYQLPVFSLAGFFFMSDYRDEKGILKAKCDILRAVYASYCRFLHKVVYFAQSINVGFFFLTDYLTSSCVRVKYITITTSKDMSGNCTLILQNIYYRKAKK